MKSKNIYLRSAMAILVVASLCACLFASNTTLAKYTAAGSGDANIDVAKWSIFVKEATSADLVIDHDSECLYDPGHVCEDANPSTHVHDAGCNYEAAVPCNLGCTDVLAPSDWQQIVTPNTVASLNIKLIDTVECVGGADAAAGAQDTHVKPGFIAPGTGGDFSGLEVYNDSDVTADIVVKITFEVGSDAEVLILDALKFSVGGAARATYPAATGFTLTKSNVAPGAAVQFTDADINWIWPFDDGTFDDTNSGTIDATDPLGLDAVGLLNGAGYLNDNVIGANAALNQIEATVTVYAIQVN